MKLVTIYQVKNEYTRERAFMSLTSLNEIVGAQEALDMSVYEAVFGETNIEGAVLFYAGGRDADDYAYLNTLFQVCNFRDEVEADTLINHFGYKGRSMSVSDVVRINDRYYYCDSFGWSEVEVVKVPHWVTIGMKATGSYFSDTYPFEVIKMTPASKVITIRELSATPAEGHDHFGSQKYDYSSNENNRTYTVRRHKNGNWKTPCGMNVYFGSARKYDDPHC